MSRFVQQNKFGDPIELELIERDAPDAGPGEVRVRVTSAGLNPVDWKLAINEAFATGAGLSLPTGFGHDLAGVVDQVGKGVEGFAVGDRVFGGARGRALADHAIVNPVTDTLTHTPEGLDDVTAGALAIAARTADAALNKIGVAEGDTVLVSAAAGGVGVFTVQVARQRGATVIGTASTENHDFLSSLGVTPVAYGPGLAERVRQAAPQGITAAIDLHGTEVVEAAIELGVAPERISTIAAGPNPPHGVQATGGVESSREALEVIAAAVAEGSIQVPVHATFPLEQAAEAIELQRTGHVRGKVVITP